MIKLQDKKPMIDNVLADWNVESSNDDLVEVERNYKQ